MQLFQKFKRILIYCAETLDWLQHDVKVIRSLLVPQETMYTTSISYHDKSMLEGNVVQDTLSIGSIKVLNQAFLVLTEETPQPGATYFKAPADGIVVKVQLQTPYSNILRAHVENMAYVSDCTEFCHGSVAWYIIYRRLGDCIAFCTITSRVARSLLARPLSQTFCMVMIICFASQGLSFPGTKDQSDGLGTPPFLNMINQTLLAAPQFSFWFDVQSNVNTTVPYVNTGEFVFGGSNPARYTGTHTQWAQFVW